MVRTTGLIAAFFTLAYAGVMAAPTDDVPITVKNNCGNNLQIYQLTNDKNDLLSLKLDAGSSTVMHVPKYWGGRIWARDGCSEGADCQPGAAASLAEFLISGSMGKDYYDVSFVDGYNLPISIAPNDGDVNGYECGAPACSILPDCPKELQETDANGNVIGCRSACAAFGTDEYCCTGEYGRGLCGTNVFAVAVKSACPDVYSYAHDDSTSMYACQNTGYTVTFCPN
ncbi:thaumatin [Pilobolus umbonatus]|nr:thaumatin [Pilobolus umbonatus]